jgi:hypothetical protein
MDLLKAFLGNASVNTFPRLRYNKESGVFRAKPHHAVARQRCDKYILVEANLHATVEQAVFSACPALTSHDNSG